MRTKKVTVRYCDHCSTRKFTVPAMVKHETGCTMNPNRVCGMCKMAEIEQKPLSELIPLIPKFDPENPKTTEGDEIRKSANGCPACILAAIRQSPGLGCMNFDWKAESKAWLKEYAKPYQYDL